MTVWSIVGCGPSLDWEAIDPPGSVICVNRGIQGATKADFWCAIDKPNAEHRVCKGDVERLRPVVLTMKRKARVWSRWSGLELRVEHEDIDEGANAVWVYRERWKKGQRNKGPKPKYSIFFALAWAVRQGAEEVHFFGVDLAGDAYHTGIPERERAQRNGRRWSKRWREGSNHEVDQMRRVYQAATVRGVRMVGLPDHVTCALPSKV